jgi:hypothetical protein
MKRIIYLILLLVIIVTACAPTQKITGLWVNPETRSHGPYKSAFIIVLTSDKNINYSVESQMAKVIRARGLKAVKSNDIFPPKFSPTSDITREQLAEAIKRNGCDAVLVISLLDTKTEEQYHTSSSYSPMVYGFNGTYYGYYNNYYPQLYTPGYYTSDKTFYIQCNLYDLAGDKLIWSVMSEAHNPKDITSWFQGYSKMLVEKLEKESLIRK